MHIIWTPVVSSIVLLPDQSQDHRYFLVAVSESSEGAQSCFDTALELVEEGNLTHSHVNAWAEMWLGSRVELVGSTLLNQAVIGCMFYLLSAFPSLTEAPSQFGGISPGGLSNGGHGEGQDYWGHVMWDQVRILALNGTRPELNRRQTL